MYEKPVNEIVDKIKEIPSNNVFLLGNLGTGKSTILKQYLDFNSRFAINITLLRKEQIIISNDRLFKLYQICLVIKKIITHLSEKYNILSKDILTLKNEVDDIIYSVNIMGLIGNYFENYDINQLVLYNPEILIYRLIKLIDSHNLPQFTLIVDNYDSVDASSERYQNTIKLFSKYFKLVMSSSDCNLITDDDKKRKFEKNNSLVEVNYSYDFETVKSILLDDIKRLVLLHSNFKYLILPSIDDNVIIQLIKITNGNLNDIKLALSFLLINIDYIPKEGYGKFLINYVTEETNSMKRIRKLQAKQRTLKIY